MYRRSRSRPFMSCPQSRRMGPRKCRSKGRLYNPSHQSSLCTLSIRVADASGRLIHQSSKTLSAWNGFTELAGFRVTAPELWSPESPHLYRCRVTLSSPAGEMHLDERFGIRQLEFVEHGPFKLNGKRMLLRGTQRHADHAGVAAAMTIWCEKRCSSFVRWAQTSSVSRITNRTG